MSPIPHQLGHTSHLFMKIEEVYFAFWDVSVLRWTQFRSAPSAEKPQLFHKIFVPDFTFSPVNIASQWILNFFLPNHQLPAPTRFHTILSILALHSVFALFDSTKVFPAKVTWRGTFLLRQCYFLENLTLLKVTHCFQTSLSFILLSIIVTNLVQYVLSSIASTFVISNEHSVVKATTGFISSQAP